MNRPVLASRFFLFGIDVFVFLVLVIFPAQVLGLLMGLRNTSVSALAQNLQALYWPGMLIASAILSSTARRIGRRDWPTKKRIVFPLVVLAVVSTIFASVIVGVTKVDPMWIVHASLIERTIEAITCLGAGYLASDVGERIAFSIRNGG